VEIEPTWETRRAWQMRPDRRPVMCQSWRNLAFFHWALDPEFIAQKLPPGLHVDTFDGRAWIGLVPFEMRNIRPRGLCSVPYISNFLELNVRTYVFDEQGRPGVWFFSLAANRAVAVWAARTFFSLPYFWSQMSETIREDWIDYRCLRKMEASRGTFAFRYRREGEFAEAPEASFEFFLVER
jgi:uncharacterized protein YqjF (DUF2071 family)